MGTLQFRTQLQARGPAAAVVLDEAQVSELGEGAKAFPVLATVNTYSWPGRVTRMGDEFLLGMSRQVREAAGVAAGDKVDVRLELDFGPRVVEVPPALAAALSQDAEASAAFAGLAFSHRKEFARWVAEAKRDETRQRRVEQTMEAIRAGRTRR